MNNTLNVYACYYKTKKINKKCIEYLYKYIINITIKIVNNQKNKKLFT